MFCIYTLSILSYHKTCIRAIGLNYALHVAMKVRDLINLLELFDEENYKQNIIAELQK